MNEQEEFKEKFEQGFRYVLKWVADPKNTEKYCIYLVERFSQRRLV